MNWAIHAWKPAIQQHSADGNAPAQDVTRRVFLGHRKPKIQVNDHVVFFHRRPQLQFWGVGVATELSEEADQYYGRFTVLKSFESARHLSDYRFSLRSVYRYAHPDVHFRRNYRRLPRLDFEAVKTGSIHYTKTAIGLLSEILPKRHRLLFAASQAKLSDSSLKIVYQNLESYFRENYLEYIQLLAELDRPIATLTDEMKLREVVVETNKGQLHLHEQCKIAKALWVAQEDTLGPFRNLVDKEAPSKDRREGTINDDELLRLLLVTT